MVVKPETLERAVIEGEGIGPGQ